MWLAMGVGVVPLVGWLLWWWNDLWYGFMAKDHSGNTKLPPGHMGFPIVGEMLHFLWYFKVLRRPDDYINSKRKRFGDGEGLLKSYLFGAPCIIVCSPSANKFVFKSEKSIIVEWANIELVGENSIVSVQGPAHTRIRNFLTKSINQSNALRQIAILLQPRIIEALQSWANQGTIKASKAIEKMTFANIGKYFASFEPGPALDDLNECFLGLMSGVRAYRINIPGTAFHHSLQCRKKAEAIFKEELEKRKKREKTSSQPTKDLLDGLMGLKDDEGNQLSDTEVLDNIVSLVVAGYISTALTSMWAVYYLAKYPKVLHKLREETMSLKNSKNDGELITYEIVNLKYTSKVAEEAIRMTNVSAFMFRKATEDVEYKGYRIPKGWKVILWLRYFHTNPENFEDPMCFEPDRWDAPMKSGSYIAFGGGARICAGNMLARLQLSMFLYYLTTGYKWELVNPNAGITYLPHPRPVDGCEINIKKL